MANNHSIPISQITTSTRNEQISVRVMRLWWKKSGDDVKGIELILVDEQGDTIQATIKEKLVKIFGEKVNEGDTYKIRKFSASSNRVGYDMATYHKCKIWFEYSTRVVPVNMAEIPLSAHAFYSFRDIYIGAMPEKLYIDVIGRLEHLYPIRIDINQTRRVTALLLNNENQQLCCTFFGDYIEQITEIANRFKNERKPTLVLYFVKRSVYEGEVSIKCTWGATQIIVNPDMNEVREFNQGFNDADIVVNVPGIEDITSHHPQILASANMKTLAEIEKVTAGGSYVTMATFVELDTSGGWFYNACTECIRKVTQKDDGLWYCEKEGDPKKPCSLKGIGTQKSTPRFQVKFLVMYENTNLCEFIVWDDAMTELLGKTAQQILDEDEIYSLVPPPDFRPLIEKDFIVKVKVHPIFNIQQRKTSFGVVNLCGDPRTISKWKNMYAASKEQSVSTMSSSSKDTNKTDSMMEMMREMIENEPVEESEEMTPHKNAVVVADPSDQSSATKFQEIKIGKQPLNL